jgi:hypothetical protein
LTIDQSDAMVDSWSCQLTIDQSDAMVDSWSCQLTIDKSRCKNVDDDDEYNITLKPHHIFYGQGLTLFFSSFFSCSGFITLVVVDD